MYSFTYGQSRDNQTFEIDGLPNFKRYGAPLAHLLGTGVPPNLNWPECTLRPLGLFPGLGPREKALGTRLTGVVEDLKSGYREAITGGGSSPLLGACNSHKQIQWHFYRPVYF